MSNAIDIASAAPFAGFGETGVSSRSIDDRSGHKAGAALVAAIRASMSSAVKTRAAATGSLRFAEAGMFHTPAQVERLAAGAVVDADEDFASARTQSMFGVFARLPAMVFSAAEQALAARARAKLDRKRLSAAAAASSAQLGLVGAVG